MTLTSQTVRAYTEHLAGSGPTPGGGSAAALCGALAAAAGAMVGSFTVGKAKFALVEADVARLLERLQALRERMLALTDADAEAYAGVGAAYARPKQTDEEKWARQAALQQALKDAAQVPLGVAEAAGEIAALLPELAEKGNPNLLSDVGVAAILASAAYEAGRLNVEVNLAGIKDAAYCAAARARIGQAAAQVQVAEAVARQVAQAVSS